MLPEGSKVVHGHFLSLCQKSVHHMNAGQCNARLKPPTVMLPVCSAVTSRYLSYPMWSAREAHMKHIPVCNTRLSVSRLSVFHLMRASYLLVVGGTVLFLARSSWKAEILRTSQAVCTSPLCPGGTKAILPHSGLNISAFAHTLNQLFGSGIRLASSD